MRMARVTREDLGASEDVQPHVVRADGRVELRQREEGVARGEIAKDSNVLYAHLGGQPALNAYSALFR